MSILVARQATQIRGLLISAIEGIGYSKDDNTVEDILHEAEYNDDSFASGYVFQLPGYNQDDIDTDKEGPISPAKEISLDNWPVGADPSTGGAGTPRVSSVECGGGRGNGSPDREISLHNRSMGVDRSTPAREISLHNRSVGVGPSSVATRGAGGRVIGGRCGGAVRGHEVFGRGPGGGCDSGCVRGLALPEENYTDRNTEFPLDVLVWPDYARLLELIKKNTRLQ
jgi:hypothetical protein